MPTGTTGDVGEAVVPHPIQQASAERLLGAHTCSACGSPGGVLEAPVLGEGTDLYTL